MTGVEQLFHILMIDLTALGLTIRAMRTDCFNFFSAFLQAESFVNADTKPIQRFEDVFFSPGYKTGGVGVFDTKEHISAVLASEQIVIQCGTYTADVKRTRWRGRKTNSYSSFHIKKSFAGAKLQ